MDSGPLPSMELDISAPARVPNVSPGPPARPQGENERGESGFKPDMRGGSEDTLLVCSASVVGGAPWNDSPLITGGTPPSALIKPGRR